MGGALVTGATGFLGTHLVEFLHERGLQPHVLHPAGSDRPILDDWARRGIPVIRYGRYDELTAIVADVSPQRVFHLATHYLKDHAPADVGPLIDANVSFGAHLLESVVGSGATVVCAMSYFQFRGGTPHPASLYSATKQALMDIADFYRAQRQLDVRHVVLFDTYGPGDTREKLVPRLVQAVADGGPVAFGPSQQQLNLLFVDDVSRAFVAASDPGGAPVMAIRAPANCTVGELVSMFGEVSGHQVDAIFSESGSTNDLVNIAGEWPSPPGWTAAVTLPEGVRRTLGRD